MSITYTQVIPIRPENFSKKNLLGKYCLSPFVSVEIGVSGEVRLCGCSAWMPTTIGNILEDSIENLLSSALAQDIRQSIINGSYTYCNEKTCSVIQNNQLNTKDMLPVDVVPLIEDSSTYKIPREIIIAGDLTCNLSCPSCRTEVIKLNNFDKHRLLSIGKQLKKNLFSTPTDQIINVTLSTSGELFASPILLEFVKEIDTKDFPNLTLTVQTNGLLIKQNWKKLGSMQNRVKKITVTIDAAEPNTYEKLRRGGKWKDIMTNMHWLAEKKSNDNIKLHTRMVVQKDNYQQMLQFYNMSKMFKADVVEYTRILQIGQTYEELIEHDVFNPQHVQYIDAIKHASMVRELDSAILYNGL